MNSARMRIPDHVLYRSVAGAGGIVLDLDRKEYFALDPVAARIWELLSESGELSEVVQAMALEFDADPAALKEDVAGFLDNLAARGLIERPSA